MKSRRNVFVRSIRQDEAQMYFQWATESSINEFDPDVALSDTSTTWCAYDRDGPLAYQTLQQPIFLESLAPRPGITKEQAALALKELTQNAITQAHLRGIKEIYFLGSDKDTDEFASNHIFERVNMPLFRLKVKDLTCG